jgi:DNA-binding transcriptional ArsR family regulator
LAIQWNQQLDLAFAALADPTRRAMLARLAAGEATVTELGEPFDMTQPSVSKHLKVLERAGLISRGRAAQTRPCRLEMAPLKEIADWMAPYRQLWDESFDRLDAYLQAPPRPPKIGKKNAAPADHNAVFEITRQVRSAACRRLEGLERGRCARALVGAERLLDRRQAPGVPPRRLLPLRDGVRRRTAMWGASTTVRSSPPNASSGSTRSRTNAAASRGLHSATPVRSRILNSVVFTEHGGETTVALRAEPFGEVDAERRYFIDLRPSLEQGYGGRSISSRTICAVS